MLFETLKQYAGGYNVVNSCGFSDEEIAMVSKASVVASNYGASVCFFMKSGIQHYIPVSRDSVYNIGDSVDLSKAKILTLERDGETITRIEI